MKKLLLLISCIYFLMPTSAKSQTETPIKKNRYFVTMHMITEKNIDSTKILLQKFTDATDVEFNKTDSTYIVSTYRVLNKQVIFGKLRKFYNPIKYMILEGEPMDPFPTPINTGNQEQDALDYYTQKMNWIKKYPLEYKKMADNLKNN